VGADTSCLYIGTTQSTKPNATVRITRTDKSLDGWTRPIGQYSRKIPRPHHAEYILWYEYNNTPLYLIWNRKIVFDGHTRDYRQLRMKQKGSHSKCGLVTSSNVALLMSLDLFDVFPQNPHYELSRLQPLSNTKLSVYTIAVYEMDRQQFPDLHVSMIDEDPHLRKRTVPMKVLVLGYPRTGTSCTRCSKAHLG